jgi:ThiF family
VTVPIDQVRWGRGRCLRPTPGRSPQGTEWPVLPQSLRPLWRGSSSLQLGLDPTRAVVIDGVDEPLVGFLLGLDGSRTGGELLAEAAAAGVDPGTVFDVVDQLRRFGVVTDGVRSDGALDGGEPEEGRRDGAQTALLPGRLGADLASLELLAATAAAPVEVLRRRRAAAVVVHGAGRVGASLAALLAAAGVGRVSLVDHGPVRPADVAPAGLAAADVDRSRMAAATDAIRRCAPEVETALAAPGQPPELVVLCGVRAHDTDLQAALHSERLPHLVAGVRETTAVVGPLVQPGLTSCIRCADLHRADRDEAWPILAAQLASTRRRRDEPCDVVLATLAAATAALQCLTQLEGGLPATAGATLELALPDWRLRRRTWPAHPRCECGATDIPLRASESAGRMVE